MRVGGIEEGSLLKIDEILLRDLDKEEKLRTVGGHARAGPGWLTITALMITAVEALTLDCW